MTAPVKLGNYETPPTEQLDWTGLVIALSIVKTTSRCCSPIHEAVRNYFIALECSLEDVQIKCDDIVLDL